MPPSLVTLSGAVVGTGNGMDHGLPKVEESFGRDACHEDLLMAMREIRDEYREAIGASGPLSIDRHGVDR